MKHFRFYPPLMLLVALLSCLPVSLGQGYIGQFDQALQSRDLVAQRKILEQWQQADPNDRDLFVARYNYYLHLVADSVVTDEVQVQTLQDSALAALDQGIAAHPRQLDLRFGKAFHYAMLHQWDAWADALVATLDYSATIRHQWHYGYFNGDGEESLTVGLLDFMEDLFDHLESTDRPTAADTLKVLSLRRVAKRMVQLFPSNVQALNYMAVSYAIFGDYDKALRYLQRAEAIDPSDPIVRQNIADLQAKIRQ